MSILRRLWAGETVAYDGPAGHYESLAFGDVHAGPPPELWYGTFGLTRAAKAAAACMDGVLLVPNMTPRPTAQAVARLRRECELIDRDAASLRVAPVLDHRTELDELETRQLAHARAFTYLQAPGDGNSLCRVNGWDGRLSPGSQSTRGSEAPARTTSPTRCSTAATSWSPQSSYQTEWILESCAIGSIADCLTQFQGFRDAGADELVTYGSTPGRNAKLAAAWASRS